MKSTGIVRRIDELGRVVVPKEIRRTLAIKDNDPVEISVEDGAIVLRKYEPEDGIATTLNKLEAQVDTSNIPPWDRTVMLESIAAMRALFEKGD